MTPLVVALLALAEPTHVHEIPDAAVFDMVARRTSARPDIASSTKYLTPAVDDPALLPTVYQNVNIYPFHVDFMAAEFPDRFPGLTTAEYRRLVEQRATRRYFAGELFRLLPRDGSVLYGFHFYTDPSRASELPGREDVAHVFAGLSETFAAGRLAYAPVRPSVIERVETWEDTPFPIYLPERGLIGNYRAYTPGVAYGRVAIFTIAELLAASAIGSIGWQDVVVVDEAPPDLAAPVAAMLTGSPQTDLSHLALRLSQRRTPNAYRAGITDELAGLKGRLVRVDVTGRSVGVVEVEDPEEAEAWWRTHRSRLPSLPVVDTSDDRIRDLDDLPVPSLHGSKASNMALLRTELPAENTVDGFAIPFAWYERFMTENTIGGVSYAEHLAALVADERFRTDPVAMTRALDDFVEHAEDRGRIPDGLVPQLVDRLIERFGGETMVRFRSSASLEDIVPFNGAGLYDSTSVCAVDGLDGDTRGPSRCDPTQRNERNIERGLRKVWASLWLPRAFRERDFWQAPHELAAMGVLVTPAFLDEAANGVVLTGNPTRAGDDRFVVNVQLGETDVVDPSPGVLPEKLLLDVEDGVVREITRVRPSTLVPQGERVLSDDEARTVGELAARAHAAFASRFDTGLGDILLDLEFKVVEREGGRAVVFKQMRPFLSETAAGEGTVTISVPADAAACGVFVQNRTLETEHALLSTVELLSGRLDLPARAGRVEAELFAAVLGDGGRILEPLGRGELTCVVSHDASRTNFEYSFSQDFAWDERSMTLEIDFPAFWVDEAGRERREVVVDEALLTLDEGFVMKGRIDGGAEVIYSSCTYELLPLFRTRVVARTGERLELLNRHQRALQGTGPENLVWASADLGDGPREVADYWDLVFTATVHNWNRRVWVLLDPPLGAVAAVEFREQERFSVDPPVFRLLDADFNVIRDLVVANVSRERVLDDGGADFVRGDVNVDAGVDIADALAILDRLFMRAQELDCPDAADADDDGRVTITDVVRILHRLFLDAADLPWPGTVRCGRDPTGDPLSPCGYPLGMCGL